LQYGLAVSDNHYFNPKPSTPSKRQTMEIELGGTKLTVISDKGVFSSSGVDKGTQILLKNLDMVTKAGTAMDLGAGWGAISIALAIENPALEVLAIEINSRAVELIEANANSLALSNIKTKKLSQVENGSIDQIWSNPPIRIGKSALHELLIDALSKLKQGGEAFLVVQKHLGADSLAKWLEQEQNHSVEKIDNSKGFRVFRVTKG
jgi:16S rRNA (guanine1207-N2)-methyltransferase